ncbi:unnamed protein product [Cuscuta epithymum]|uniref:Eukaryotic translation initiation factor 4G n=2 Tax=Cuscuta epithymum TaxID=186058 RepID=A0AAV0EVA2_9ASTE|nr:unnamed protein product [Cuscuta epithymum]
MSQNQSRTGNRDSHQHRKPGRPGSFNQNRDSKGGGGSGGFAPASSPSSPFNKKHNNAEGGYQTKSDPVQNVARQEQSSSGLSDAHITASSLPSSSTSLSNPDALKQKENRGVPRPPSSNFPAGPDYNVPATPVKDPADGFGPVPLQFGSISPSFMNGMQVPARTSSAPPNMDEQNGSKACLDAVKAMPGMPNPSTSKLPPGKGTEKFEQSSNISGSGSVHSRSKRDVPVSTPPSQMQKPFSHPMTGNHVQVPLYPAHPQIPVEFGGCGQFQPKTSSLPIQMTVPLYVNPSLPQQMFVGGPSSHHPMSSQGIWQNGQGLSFSSPGINPHVPFPPQLGNMGMTTIPSPFPQQHTAMYGSFRKTIKIIDPKTHEELRLDGSHPSIPVESQPLSSFPPTPLHYYPNSYNNNSSVFFQAPNSSRVSQATRVHNQVTIKPGPGKLGEKDQVSVKPPPDILGGRDQLTVKDSHEHSKPLVVDSVHPQKGFQTPRENLMHVPMGTAEESVLDDITEQQKRGENIGLLTMQDQAAESSTSGLGLPSFPPQTETVTKRDHAVDDINSKGKDFQIENSSKPLDTKREEDNKDDKEAKSCTVSIEHNNNSKTDPMFTSLASFELINQIEKGGLQRPASSSNNNCSSVEVTQEKVNEPATCSSEADSSDVNSKRVPLSVGLSPQDQHMGTKEIAFPTSVMVEENSLVDQDAPTSAAARRVKEKNELYKNADGVNFDDSSNPPFPAELEQDIALIKEDTEVKAESNDLEGDVNVSSQNLETSKTEIQTSLEFKSCAEDGEELKTKKYSRDFLLKFASQCTDLPEGFEITTDSAETLMASDVKVSNKPYQNHGKMIDNRRSVGSRPDYHGSGVVREEKWSKLPGALMSGRDTQGGNFGGHISSSLAQSPLPYGGGNLVGPIGVHGGGMQRGTVDADRWQRGTAFHKGSMHFPHSPSQVMHKAEKKYEVGKVTDEEQAKQRQLKAILNKLTPQNFEKLFQQVKDVNIDNVTTLSGVISQIFDKALMEPTFCEMYANFCSHLAAELPDLSINDDKVTFKRLLLNKCQEEFERGKREEEEANLIGEVEGETKLSDEEREEKRLKARRRMLGNIRLIGELYKKKMLTERIMHMCIQILLGESENQNPDEENIEALCKLMSTIGAVIDHEKAKDYMDSYFSGMANLSNNMKLSSRVRFMLKDAIDLRKNKWQQRRKVEGPKKIEEVHRDAAQERLTQASRTSFGRRGQHIDYSPRGPSMLPSPSSQMSGIRQTSRLDDRSTSENRPLSLPLTQRSLGEHITLGPQGGLTKGLSFRGHTNVSRVSSANIHSSGSSNKLTSGVNGLSSMPEGVTHGSREDGSESHILEKLPTSPTVRVRGTNSTQNVLQDKVLPEERLQELSITAIKEFYSARDEKEIALCVKDLNAPSFHPSMISIWISDSFERKDTERGLLEKLLVNLTKSQDVILSSDQLIRGFECVLLNLEDTVNDAPRAAEFLGRIFARVVWENVVPLEEIGRLLREGGEEEGQLIETGLAADVLGSTLEMIKSEKGDSLLNDLCRRSNLLPDNFRPPGSSKKSKLDKFLIP